MTVTPDQVEKLLRRYSAQLPVRTDLSDARSEMVRAHIARIVAAESHRGPRSLRWLVSAGVAAALAILWLTRPAALPRAADPFEVAVGPTPDELFHAYRAAPTSAPAARQVFVGVLPTGDMFVRLLGRDHLGRFESLPLDSQSTTTKRIENGKTITFGGFEIEQATGGRVSRLTHIVVICTNEPISDESVRETLRDLNATPHDAAGIEGCADWLRRRLRAGIRVRAIDPVR